MTTFKKTQFEKAVELSLLEAVNALGSVTDENKDQILEKGYEIISKDYTFLVEEKEKFDEETGEKRIERKTCDWDTLVNPTKVLGGWEAYKRIADFSKLPIENPFHHKEDTNKFIRACIKLFPNVDGFNAGRCLTTFRQVIENVYYNLGFEGLKPQQVCFYQYSALGGTGKSEFYKKLEHFAKKYNLPICHEDVKGRWVGNAFSSNLFGIVNEFFPPKNNYEVEETIKKFNNIVDNELYEVEYKGQDHFYVKSRCTLFVNSNKLPFDGNTRRYGIVNYNEVPFKLIKAEDREKYFPSRTDEEWDEILLEAFESCPFGEVFEDIECKNSENLNDLIFAARKVVKHACNMPFEIGNATIREFTTHYLELMNDFGKVDPSAVKKQIYIWRNDIRKAVALGQIVPTQRINGNLDYSRYNFQDISNMMTCEDDIKNNLNDIANPFERTKVAFERFIDPELDPKPTDPKPTDPKPEIEIDFDKVLDAHVGGDNRLFNSTFEYEKEDGEKAIGFKKPTTKNYLQEYVTVNETIDPEKLSRKNEDMHGTNYLLEMDDIPKEEQKKLIQNLPQEVKRAIHWICDSGNKSIHTVLVTDTDTNKTNEREAVLSYINKTYFQGHLDMSAKNAGRLGRNPNGTRRSNGKRQTLYYYNNDPEPLHVGDLVERERKAFNLEALKRTLDQSIKKHSKDPLTVETLQKRRETPGRNKAIDMLKGVCDWEGMTSACMYLLSTGFERDDIEGACGNGDKWLPNALKEAEKNLAKSH